MGEKQSVHHSYVWLEALRAGLVIVVAVFVGLSQVGVSNYFLGDSANDYELYFSLEAVGQGAPSSSMLVVFAVLAFVVLVCVLAIVQRVWSYRNLYYVLEDVQFSFYSGILNKKRIHVPYQRVQSVNYKATLIQRIIGVCTVTVETAGGSANEGITIPYVTTQAAEKLRAELFRRKEFLLAGLDGKGVMGQPDTFDTAFSDASVSIADARPPVPASVAAQPHQGSSQDYRRMLEIDGARNVLDAPDEVIQDLRGLWGGKKVDTGTVSFEYGLSNKELFLTALTAGNLAIVFVFVFFVGVAELLSVILPGLIEGAGQTFGSILNALSGSVGIVVAGVILGCIVMVFMWLISIIATCIMFGGFRARRRDNRVEVEYGLLSRQYHGVDVDRIQSVNIKEPFFRRLFGFCTVTFGVISTNTNKEESGKDPMAVHEGVVVHPCVKRARVAELLQGLVPELSDLPQDTQSVDKVALRRCLIRAVVWEWFGLPLIVIAALLQLTLYKIYPQVSAVDVLLTTDSSTAFVAFALQLTVNALYLLGTFLVVVGAIWAILWFRGSNFAADCSFVQITNGGFTKRSIYVPRKKIQSASVLSNPLQRRAKVATLSVRTAAGSGTTIRLRDVGEIDAEKWLNWLGPQGLKDVTFSDISIDNTTQNTPVDV